MRVVHKGVKYFHDQKISFHENISVKISCRNKILTGEYEDKQIKPNHLP